jgi:hypothetical protein
MSSTSKARHSSDKNTLLREYRVSRRVTDEAIHHFLSALDCPKALAVWLLYESGEHEQLVDLETNPFDFNTVDEFRRAYAATCLLSKSDFLKLDRKRDAVAYEKFEKFELLCKQTNDRFRFGATDGLYAHRNVWLHHATVRKIASILGPLRLEEVVDQANWGPGVTNAIKGESATSVNKFQYETGITRDLYSLWTNMEGFPPKRSYPMWQEHLRSSGVFPTFEIGSVTVTVPKDAKTDRVISVEPGFNLWFQKGLGQCIRHRLRSKGVDLNRQEVNQSLAQVAITLGLATVDFSSASDSIALELVRSLIPPDWFDAMDACRSHYGRRSGSFKRWEKFSSMGNGFTFELESLIFFSAASAVCDSLEIDHPVISVYGDDVIIPNQAYELFSSFCHYLGFRINDRKSFYSGVFRESCGSHYFEELDVKPIFLKKRLTTPNSVFKFANAIRRFAHRNLNYMGCDVQFRKVFQFLIHQVPKPLRLRIPDGYGDGGFIANLDESVACVARDHKKFPTYEGFTTHHASFSPVKDRSEEVGIFLSRLRSSSNLTGEIPYRGRTYDAISALRMADGDLKPQGNEFALRGRVVPRVSLLYVNRWYNLGPWF